MTSHAIEARIRRLDDLRSRLAAEIVRVPHAMPELTANERAAYLMGIQDALEGFDPAQILNPEVEVDAGRHGDQGMAHQPLHDLDGQAPSRLGAEEVADRVKIPLAAPVVPFRDARTGRMSKHERYRSAETTTARRSAETARSTC